MFATYDDSEIVNIALCEMCGTLLELPLISFRKTYTHNLAAPEQPISRCAAHEALHA